MALVTCPPPCNTVCRLPKMPTGKIRCGKCKRVFTPRELVKATPEAPPTPPPSPFTLEQERDRPLDSPFEDPYWICMSPDCGWEGDTGDLDGRDTQKGIE